MTTTIKIRLKQQDKYTLVRTLISHPMETGRRKNKDTGAVAPAYFIQELVIFHNDKIIVNAMLGSAISKDPYFSVRFQGGKPGDKVTITWTDNLGKTDTANAIIK